MFEQKKYPLCRQVFRYLENNYHTENRIVYTQEFRRMKRLSCSGDHKGFECHTPFDDGQMAGIENIDIRKSQALTPGRLYELVFTPDGVDFETGYLDGWSWLVVPYKPTDKGGCLL